MLIKNILSGKTNQISKPILLKQRLAASMAWQILNIYPSKNNDNNWKYYNNLNGVLLADEVGGGKTFEALSILTKTYFKYLENGKRNFRVLIIANPAIRSKWEWRDVEPKGNNECDLEKFLKQTNFKNQYYFDKISDLFENETLVRSKNSWKDINKRIKNKCIVLTSVQALPTTQGRKNDAEFKRKFKFPYNKFDLVIADEAHIVKSGYLQTNEDISAVSGSAVRRLFAVLNSNPKAKIMLLTATPFHNNVHELIQMISILDHKNDSGVVSIVKKGLEEFNTAFNNLKTFTESTEEFKLKLNNLYKATNNDINRFIENKVEKYSRPKELRKSGQKDGLDDFLRDIMIRNRKEKLTEKISLAVLNEKEKLNYLLLRDLIQTKDEDAKKMISLQLCQLVSNPESFNKSLINKRKNKDESRRSNIHSDIIKYFKDDLIYKRKYRSLLKTIESFQLNKKKVITIFCRFIPAIERLQKDFKKDNYHVEILHGKMKLVDRITTLERLKGLNKKTQKKIIFVVSQVGYEGLDFDEFSNTIIHYDSHYNPAVISQRNGRVYRRGNKASDINVYHIILSETYDQRIKFIEEEKRKMKDFYLGDSNLESLFDKIYNQDPAKKKEMFNTLKKFRIDLQPRKQYLLPIMKREI